MNYSIVTTDPARQATECIVVGVFENRRLSAAASKIDKASEGYIAHVLRKGDFTGKAAETLLLYEVPGTKCERVLLAGCGKKKEFDIPALEKMVAQAVAVLNAGQAEKAVFCLDGLRPQGTDRYQTAKHAVIAAESSVYRFDRLKTKPDAPKRPLRELALAVLKSEEKDAGLGVAHGHAIANGVRLARDLANLPGNICTPAYLADQAHALHDRFPRLEVSVLEEHDMETLGMGALLSVSRGSRQPAKLIVIEHQGGKKEQKPVVLVGKGLTFDAGGISIKPAEAMDEMKYDMCGGASVLGTLATCAELDMPLNVVGIVPASENLPDGNANKPGDVVTSMSGQTIEILNTDAEGRLILCDALTYSERYHPAAVIDIATLTGACVIALGAHASGLFSNDQSLEKELVKAGLSSNDRVWPMPVWEDYQKQLDSNFADMANVGGRQAGAITAACFLARYTKKMRWAHLDIAGTAWLSGKEKGATGRPVALLSEFLLAHSRS